MSKISGQNVFMSLLIFWSIVIPYSIISLNLNNFRMLRDVLIQNPEKISLEKLQAEIRELETGNIQLKEDIFRRNEILPSGKKPSEVYGTVTHLARKNDIRIVRIEPQETSEDSAWGYINFQVVARGNFHATAAFIFDLEENGRFLKIKRLQLTKIALSDRIQTEIMLCALLRRQDEEKKER